MSTLKISIVFIAIIALMVGAFYWYFNWSQHKIADLQGQNAALTAAVDIQKQTIEAQAAFKKKQDSDIAALQTGLQAANDAKTALEEKFLKNDLAALGVKDPAALEKKLNNATDRAFRDLEVFTGAKPTAAPSTSPTCPPLSGKCSPARYKLPFKLPSLFGAPAPVANGG